MYDISIVGSAGFLGSAIVRAARSQGHSVAEFGRSNPVVVDGRVSPDVENSSHIVWAAGSLSPVVAQERPDLVREELAAFEAALSALSARAPHLAVILLGSGGTAYDVSDPAPHSETSPVGPASAYGRYKLAQEEVLRESGLAHTVLRVANAYGPGQLGARGQGVLAFWMRAILSGQPIQILGSTDVARDYIYVDDVAGAVIAAMSTEGAPSVLNVGSGTPTTLGDLLNVVKHAVGGLHPVRVEHLPARGVDAPSTWLDVAEAARTVGWAPTTPLDTGVSRMWEWLSR